MINVELRAQGIGGSDVAAIVGLDPRRDAFAVYADKLGLVERSEPNARMKWGKRLERVIVDAYSEETGRSTIWIDETRRNPAREWQVYTPDAMCTAMLRGIDAKNVSFDQAAKWGEIGSDLVPDSIALQCQWYCSSADIPVWDVAALFGGNDLRIYTVNRDPEIEAALLEEAENFWKNHVLARVPPPIGSSATAAEYIRKRFPRNTEAVRFATPEEVELLGRYRAAREAADAADEAKTSVENEVKLAIGDAEGIMAGASKVTYKRAKDTVGPDWQALAMELGADAELIKKHTVVLREGSRRIHCTFK